MFYYPVNLQAFFNPGLDCGQQILSFEVWTGIIIRESSALRRSDLMDSAPFYHSVTCLKDAGSVIFYLEGISVLHKAFPDFSVSDGKMPGQSVDINGINQQDRTFQSVTAITGTVITVIHNL